MDPYSSVQPGDLSAEAFRGDLAELGWLGHFKHDDEVRWYHCTDMHRCAEWFSAWSDARFVLESSTVLTVLAQGHCWWDCAGRGHPARPAAGTSGDPTAGDR
jgi:hypothetical protein